MNVKVIKEWLNDIATPTGISYSGDQTISESMVKNIVDYVEELEQQCKKQKEVIDKAVSILKDNFVYDYVRSCDTTNGVGYDEIDTEHFTYRVYEILNEYVKLIDKGYCEECNELNCIDNFPHKKIASAISDLQLENTKLKGKLKKQQEIIDKIKLIIKGVAYGGSEDYYMEKFSKINELIKEVSE